MTFTYSVFLKTELIQFAQFLLVCLMLWALIHLGSSLLDKPEFFDIFLIQGRCSTPDLVSLVFPQPAATGLANVARYVVNHHLHKGAFLTHVQLSVYQGASRPFLQSCPAGNQCPTGGIMQKCLHFHC